MKTSVGLLVAVIGLISQTSCSTLDKADCPDAELRGSDRASRRLASVHSTCVDAFAGQMAPGEISKIDATTSNTFSTYAELKENAATITDAELEGIVHYFRSEASGSVVDRTRALHSIYMFWLRDELKRFEHPSRLPLADALIGRYGTKLLSFNRPVVVRGRPELTKSERIIDDPVIASVTEMLDNVAPKEIWKLLERHENSEAALYIFSKYTIILSKNASESQIPLLLRFTLRAYAAPETLSIVRSGTDDYGVELGWLRRRDVLPNLLSEADRKTILNAAAEADLRNNGRIPGASSDEYNLLDGQVEGAQDLHAYHSTMLKVIKEISGMNVASTGDAEKNVASLLAEQSENSFRTDRGEEAYRRLGSSKFAEDVEKLGPEDYLYDFGAGAGIFGSDMIERKGIANAPTYVGFSLAHPGGHSKQKWTTLLHAKLLSGRHYISVLTGLYKGKWKYHEGDILALDVSTLPKAKMGVERWGFLTYYPNPQVALEKEFAMLAVGASLDIGMGFPAGTHLFAPDGRTISLLDYFRKIKGASLTEYESEGKAYNQTLKLRFIKTSETVIVPDLELISATSGSPGHRILIAPNWPE